MSLVVNAIDYLVTLKYFSGLLGRKTETAKRVVILLWIIASLVTTYVNSINNPFGNLLCTVFCIGMISLCYGKDYKQRLIMLLLYLGVGILGDTIATWTMVHFTDIQRESQNVIYMMAFSVVIRYFVVEIFIALKKEKNMQLPKWSTVIITIIFTLSVVGSVWLNIGSEGKRFNIIGTLFAVLLLAGIYFFMFLIMEEMNQILSANHEKEMLLQEARFNEIYIRDMEQNNLELAKVRHDFKNTLSPFYDLSVSEVDEARECIRGLYDELVRIENNVITRNRALNSILKIKFSQAERNQIEIKYHIQIPDKINMDYGDMGIVFGNTMDNAIEACQDCKIKSITVNIELNGTTLFIVIHNTKKITQSGGMGQTSKEDHYNHGLGLKSVQEILNKYNGLMQLEDQGEIFEVRMILYGIEGKQND